MPHFGAWFGLGLYARLYRDCFLVSTQLFRWETGGQSPAPRQALGGCRDSPLPSARHLGKQYQHVLSRPYRTIKLIEQSSRRILRRQRAEARPF